MNKCDIERVRNICHEADLLVSSDPRAPDLDVLEKARLKMNDFLWQERYEQAEIVAYAISLMQAGQEAGQYLLKEVGD